ncbi:hypothetical protein ACHAWX_003359 [Stephanocyclus meneghinianus]
MSHGRDPTEDPAADDDRRNAIVVTLPSGASYPRFLEPLTSQELSLLDAYAVVKSYEREAARIKAEEAKRRLEEADERYRAKVREREGGGQEEKEQEEAARRPDDDDDEEPQDASDDDDDDEEGRRRRLQRESELSQLRRDVAAAKEAKDRQEAEKRTAKQKEEAMRKELLGESVSAPPKRPRDSDDDDHDHDSDEDDDEDDERGFFDDDAPAFAATGPSIKKKRLREPSSWDESKPAPSLIANIGGGITPPHDFSKKLGMSNASLDGTVLFPKHAAAAAVQQPWQPPPKPRDFLDGCLELELYDFDPASLSESHTAGNNTLAIKFHAPDESARFSINIAAPRHDDYNNILFHFNPRHFQRGGQLVINDRKESMWGNDIAVPLSTMPLMFGKVSCTLIIQINEEGFDVFVEDKHCARLEHRTDLTHSALWGDNNKRKGSLFLQFPSSDDYGNPENWRVFRVWWGRKAGMAKSLEGVAGVQSYSAVHPKKLFVSGLAKLKTDPEVDLRRAELERAFRKYGGPSGAVAVVVPKDSTFAFVECHSEQLADLAVREMGERYRVNKARRTKHEALMEERAAKEVLERGNAKESTEWD